MQLQINVPNDAEHGSKWMIFRRSGKLSFATLIDGVLYNGDQITEDDCVAELDVEDNYEDDGDAVMYYALIEGQKEVQSVGSDLKLSVTIDHEALSAVLGKLDRVAELLKQIPEASLVEYRRRGACNALSIIESIKDDILE